MNIIFAKVGLTCTYFLETSQFTEYFRLHTYTSKGIWGLFKSVTVPLPNHCDENMYRGNRDYTFCI